MLHNIITALSTRTAILLYVSLALNAAMYQGYLINKAKLQVTVCTAIEDAVATYQEDMALPNAIDKKDK